MFARLRDILKGKARNREEIIPAEPLEVLDPADDEALASLIEELQSLGCVQVPAAARHRCWAAVRAEVRQRQARGAFTPVSAKVKGAVHSRRVALVSTVALVAVALGIVGVLQFANPGRNPGVADSTVTTATTELADGSSTTKPSGTTGTVTSTPQTGTSTPASSSTSGSSVTVPGTDTTANTGTTAAPPLTSTTKPQTTTSVPGSSTTQVLMTSEEREKSAKEASAVLAQAVVNGDTGSATAVLTSSAAKGLALMKVKLVAPQSFRFVEVDNVTQQYSRVLVEFTDSVGGQSVTKYFIFEVKIDPSKAVITGIFYSNAQ
jgi:hypothetical protein